jgi:NAD(P)-dependent dehydrogenase (short-subunit alcohol dehydrogenase family)
LSGSNHNPFIQRGYVRGMQRLSGQVAVVTGATRGAGLGIAKVLGGEGATVYVTGRSVREAPVVPEYPGSIEDAADEVSARGGHGVPVRCDHTDEQAVQGLFDQVLADQGRLDLLVSNAWAGYMPYPEHSAGPPLRLHRHRRPAADGVSDSDLTHSTA